MTDREKAIVMAYTGVTMLNGDKLGVFYDYVSEIMGSRIDTLGIAILAENIKSRSKPHFIRLCEQVEEPVRHGRWELYEDWGSGMSRVDPPEPFDAGWKCSCCGIDLLQYLKSHFSDIPSYAECASEETPTVERCPHCGAKMEGVEDNA